MDKPDGDLQGLDDELIERLLAAVNSDDVDWESFAAYLVFALGGDLLRIIPDTGREPEPGTVGAERRKTHELVGRDPYFRAIRDHLAQRTRSGLREDFLVRALRDEITRQVRFFADVEGGNRKRKQRREELERWAQVPERIAAFRDQMAKGDHAAAALTDDEVAERLRHLVAILAPMPFEAETKAWIGAERWNTRVAALLSDATIEEWMNRRSMRMTTGHDDRS